jgi:cobalt-precorrin 5A hydrolase
MPDFSMDTEQPKNETKKNLAVWAITANGRTIGEKILLRLKNLGPEGKPHQSNHAVLFISDKMNSRFPGKQTAVVFKNLRQSLKHEFNRFQSHIFIFSTGIAVRLIAPLLNSKLTDPAVIVMDDNATHAVSLLSGHIGGGNELACLVGSITGARPVITTATDINHLPSIDMIAQKADLHIETPHHIKRINMAFLMGETIHLHDPLGCVRPHLPADFLKEGDENNPIKREHVFCSWKAEPVSRETLILRPRVLCVGIGCNRGTPLAVIIDFLNLVFENQGLSKNSIKRIATSEIKKDEQGLLALSEKMQVKIDFYTKEQLNCVDNIQTPSSVVEKHLGVKSVCEAAAILSADKLSTGRGKLILPKQKNKDVTIAVTIIQ